MATLFCLHVANVNPVYSVCALCIYVSRQTCVIHHLVVVISHVSGTV